VIFLDPSGAMLEKARAHVEEDGLRGRDVRYVQAGLEDMSELEDESIAFATGQGDPLSFCKEPKQALRELRRVLEPDAALVLSVDSRIAGVKSLLDRASPEEMLEILRSGRTRWQAQRKNEAFAMKMFDPDELDTLLRKSGFDPLSRIAKTCLVQRGNEAWLEDARQRRKLMEAEEKVHERAVWFANASHFQVAARRS
jgi:ubiquinone/menaquinone biosynthesis C-methylase UbiE